MKTWRNLLLCFAVFGLFWLGFNSYLSKEISVHYTHEINDDFGVPQKDKSVALQQESLDKGDILILGSSELNSYVQQNPRTFFPTQEVPYVPNIIGRADVTNLEHSLNISSLDFSKNQKVVYFVSFPWFMSSAVNPNNFYANFSKLKYYQYMTDSSIPSSDKQYMATKMGELTQSNKNVNDLDAWIFSKMCEKLPFAFRAINTMAYPYLMFSQATLSTKDKVQALQYVRSQTPYQKRELKSTDWTEEYAKADEEGKDLVNEDFFYFDTRSVNYVKPRVDSQKNSQSKNPFLVSSKEYDDYRVFLETCKRKNIKPLIIVQSVNGWYFDYLGIDQAKRHAVYDRLVAMAQDYGFTAYDQSKLEYEPYAFYDFWHYGWKGWLDVDQKIADYFAANG